MFKKIFVLVIALVFLTSAAYAATTTLTVVGDAGHNMRPFEWYEGDFRELYGVELIQVGVPFGLLYESQRVEFIGETGAYDFMIVYPKFLAEFAANGWLYPLDDFIQEKDPNFDDIIPAYLEFYCKYKGEVFALPYDGDVLSLYYRLDLLENEEEKAAFLEKYGYELTVPETWDVFLDVAEFFTRKAGETLAGEVLNRDFYGTAYYGVKDQIWGWWAAMFASHGGVYFDEETFEPGINSEAAVKATEIMMEFHNYSPPDVLAYGYEELKDVFLEGDCFMVVQWPCIGKKGADPAESRIVGKIGATHVPGVTVNDEVYFRAPMPAGRVLAIAADAEDPWKAYQVIWHLSVVTSLDDVSTHLTGLDPYRFSHFEHPEAYGMFEEIRDAEIYLAGLRQNLENGFPELTLPGTVEYLDVLGVELTNAIVGAKEPQQALDDAASAWRDITNRLGFEAQKAFYVELVEGWREAGLWD